VTGETVRLCTIGFTQTTAESFFRRLTDAGVRRVIDVRLNNTSQLAGFAKAGDLAYFLRALGGLDYVHEPLLAPTPDMLTAFKKMKGDWGAYERKFLDLMERRRIDERLAPDFFQDGCLLCSEAKPHRCHRRLVAEFLQDRWSVPLMVKHL
jgi:uncharacterized protein (DUF488 family)